MILKARSNGVKINQLFNQELILKGVTAEYPATSSVLGKWLATRYAVRSENKFKMAVYLKLVATRYITDFLDFFVKLVCQGIYMKHYQFYFIL